MSLRDLRRSTSGATWFVVLVVAILIVGILIAIWTWKKDASTSTQTQSLFVAVTSVPSVDSVRVLGPVYTAPDVEFALEAITKGRGGMLVPTAQYPEIAISWQPASLFSDPATNPASLKVPNTPGVDLSVTATVTVAPAGETPVTVVSPPQVVHIAPSIEGDHSDWLFVEHPPGAPPAAAILRGMDGSTPIHDWAVPVVGAVRLGKDVQGPSQLALFAKDRSAVLLPSVIPSTTSSPGPFKSGVDRVEEDPMPDRINRFVQVRIGADAPGNLTESQGKTELQHADALLNADRAGLELTWDGYFVHGGHEADGTPVGISDPYWACGTEIVDQLIGPASGDASNPTKIEDTQSVFVLFVPDILTDVRGWACPPEADWAGRVVFLSRAEYSVTSLAHEIGHVLSLSAPWIDSGSGGGHTNGLAGFDWSNLMWSFSALVYRVNRDRLTLGQVYRMNAQAGSWLNDQLPNILARPCGTDPAVSTNCPALSKDLGGQP